MKLQMLKHAAVVATFAATSLAASFANASIVVGSTVQLVGRASISAAGDITPGTSRILDEVNSLSFAGYNAPNNPLGTFTPVTVFSGIAAAPALPFIALQLPGVVVAGTEDMSVPATWFLLRTWQITSSVVGGTFAGRGMGDITTPGGVFLASGELQFTTQFYTPNSAGNSYSATLTAIETSVIPVPGAMWIFGSGLLLMTAVMRRKVK